MITDCANKSVPSASCGRVRDTGTPPTPPPPPCTTLNSGWGCAAECLGTWPCSRLKRHNFATLFQTEKCETCRPSNRKWSIWVNMQQDASAKQQVNVCLQCDSGSQKATPTVFQFQSWNGKNYTLIQTETLICRPCSRLREATTIPCWVAHPRIAHIGEYPRGHTPHTNFKREQPSPIPPPPSVTWYIQKPNLPSLTHNPILGVVNFRVLAGLPFYIAALCFWLLHLYNLSPGLLPLASNRASKHKQRLYLKPTHSATMELHCQVTMGTITISDLLRGGC